MKTILKLSNLLLVLIVIGCSGSDDSPSCTEQTWYQDADSDGFGNPTATLSACTQPTGYVSSSLGGDLDDNNASIYPNATEICDGLDNDGDGQVDGLISSNCGVGEVCENGSCVAETTYYFDADVDGYGDASNSITAGSTAPNGYVVDSTDCDDADAAINPGAQENTTDGIDNNCDGNIDECDSNATEECDCTDGVDNDGDGNTDCDDSDCFGVSSCIQIGDFRDGGIVFYIDSSGVHGLVCAVNDQGNAIWGCDGTDIPGADGIAIGTGAQNTIDIEAGCTVNGTAADVCANLTLNGYSDWFLPSRDEFGQIVDNKQVINITASNNGGSNLIDGATYWTSSEASSGAAFQYYMTFLGSIGAEEKYDSYNFRAVRAF